jgi:predicted Rdx family selenoprotein
VRQRCRRPQRLHSLDSRTRGQDVATRVSAAYRPRKPLVLACVALVVDNGCAMEFRILYCVPCGYQERAEALADELRRRFDARVIAEEGGFGQFDVLLDGALVASKGGLLRRLLIHGAPPQPELIESIERAMADREGDRCDIPAASESRTSIPAAYPQRDSELGTPQPRPQTKARRQRPG